MCLGKFGRFNEPEHKKLDPWFRVAGVARLHSSGASKERLGKRTAAWILQATITLYTACNSHCMYYEHEHKHSGHTSDVTTSYSGPAAVISDACCVSYRCSNNFCLDIYTLAPHCPQPGLTFTILSVADLFREYDRTWFRFKLPTVL